MGNLTSIWKTAFMMQQKAEIPLSLSVRMPLNIPVAPDIQKSLSFSQKREAGMLPIKSQLHHIYYNKTAGGCSTVFYLETCPPIQEKDKK